MVMFLITAVSLFSGCSKELGNLDVLVVGSESFGISDEMDGDVLRIQISDAGFCDRKTGSRAMDNILNTTFKDGDRIGLFAVDKNNQLLFSNTAYTLKNGVWSAEDGIRLKGEPYPVRIFAYYPYVENKKIVSNVNPKAEDAAGFFEGYVEGMDITDQHTESLFRQSDLLVCMGTIVSKDIAHESLMLKMVHQMKLIIITSMPETGEVTMSLSTDPSYTWNQGVITITNYIYQIGSGEDEKKTILPYENGGKRFILLQPSATEFSGSFKENGRTKNYVLTVPSSGEYRSYRINPPQPFVLEPGDYYLNDGSLRSKDVTLTEEEKQKCVGIVYYTDILNVNGKSHGLVIALNEMQVMWSSDTKTFIGAIGDSDSLFEGYKGTQILLKYINEISYPIVNIAYRELEQIELPEGKTSGWYIPSVAELLALRDLYSTVNMSLSFLGNFASSISPSYYWSTGEYNSASGYAYAVHMTDSGWHWGILHKDMPNYVRLVFAF